jgi:hypothetical protein
MMNSPPHEAPPPSQVGPTNGTAKAPASRCHQTNGLEVLLGMPRHYRLHL